MRKNRDHFSVANSIGERVSQAVFSALQKSANAIDARQANSELVKTNEKTLLQNAVEYKREIQEDSVEGENFSFYINELDGPIQFVLDQRARKRTSQMTTRVPTLPSGVVMNSNLGLSSGFGFKDYKEYLLSNIFLRNRSKIQAYKKLHKVGYLSRSEKMNYYRAEAERANAMLMHVAFSSLWNDPYFAARKAEFDLESRFAQVIFDFCQLDATKDKLEEWSRGDIWSRINQEKKDRIMKLLEANKNEWAYRTMYLKSLEVIYNEFCALEDQYRINKEILTMDEQLARMEEQSLTLEARREALINDVNELTYVGMNLQATRIVLNSSLDEMLAELDSADNPNLSLPHNMTGESA